MGRRQSRAEWVSFNVHCLRMLLLLLLLLMMIMVIIIMLFK